MRWGEEFLSEAVNNPFYIRLPQQVTLGVIIHRFYRIKPGKGRCTRTQRTLLLQGWKFRTSLINFWRTLYLISLVDEIKQQLHENDSYLCVCRCQKDRLGLMPHFWLGKMPAAILMGRDKLKIHSHNKRMHADWPFFCGLRSYWLGSSWDQQQK